MSNRFEVFIEQIVDNKVKLDEEFLLLHGFEFIKQQLQDYLAHEGLTATTFTQAVKLARKSNNSETDRRFWSALEALYLAVGDAIDYQTSRQRWLRFVNIIECLQGYAGSQLIDERKIHAKRVKRLCLAYSLTWEHLRYIAGNENEYNPSEAILAAFSEVDVHHHG